jgi:D-aminoacyl-tRNA deacylase
MRALLQRVSRAHVEISGKLAGEIAHGLLILVCAERGDDESGADRLLTKILKLRIFPDDRKKMNLSVTDVAGGLLIVSQFTLATDVSGGNRPGFAQAAQPDDGRRLYDYFVRRARAASGRADRRVRRRHAGTPGERRPGHDFTADRACCLSA